MTPDEVRRLNNRYALLFIREELPVRDLKYDVTRHPNVAMTAMGGAKPYEHGEDTRSFAAVSLVSPDKASEPHIGADVASHYELLSEEELEEYYKKQEDTKK